MKIIAQQISQLPKKNSQRLRVVIITQGSEPTVLAVGNDIKEFPVKKPVEIVDTNGAGDSFVGGKNEIEKRKTNVLIFFIFKRKGFLAALALGKSHEDAIETGSYCALECIQQSGCTFPERPNFSV